MNWFTDRVIDFVAQSFPTWRMILIGGPLGLAWSFVCLWFAGRLKQLGARTGYTRKVFHFLVFGTVAALHWRLGTSAVCLFGGMCTLIVFFAVCGGPGNKLYEAMARETDEPRRTLFILVPYFTTLVGGLVSNIFFGPFAITGYLVTGLGDAVGEPVGTLLGKHRYRVPSLASVPAMRSWEGSAAVFVASIAALWIAAAASPHISLSSFAAARIIAIAAACTAAEALSPHGLDNAAMQIIPSGLVYVWLRG